LAALKWIGIGLLALAVLLGVVAFRATTRDRQAFEAKANAVQPTVITRRAIESKAELDAASLAIELRPDRPSEAFASIDEVIGRTSTRPLEAGALIRETDLEPLSALARSLRSGESAVAVKVDGVTGLGGFVRPGDAVDVLFFLRRDGREVIHTQARTLLVNVRVLAFGTRLDDPDSTEPLLNARTAVLAVPESAAPLLLLADIAGTLRLALRQGNDSMERATHPSISLHELLELRPTEASSGPNVSIPVIRGRSQKSGGGR